MITYESCPVCNSKRITDKFEAEDHTVSHESFMICSCIECRGMFTQGIPEMNAIGGYYQSAGYISHSDTREGIVNRLYHLVRNYTLQSKRKLVQRQSGCKTGELLDVGCGTGAFLHVMKSHGWNVTGLEPDSRAAEKAQTSYGIIPRKPEELFRLEKGRFDAITMWHVLEHVHQLHDYMEQLKSLMKPDGCLFIAVPNYTSYDAKVYGKFWAAYDVPRHLYHFSPESMGTLASVHGMKIKAIKPMWFDSFYVSMLSEKIKNKKGNFVRAFFIGLKSNFYSLFNKKKCSSLIYVIGRSV